MKTNYFDHLFWPFSNLSQQHSTGRNMSQHVAIWGWPNARHMMRQQCCDISAVGRGLTSDLLINNRSSNYQTSSIVTGLNASTVNVVFLFLLELKLSSDVNKPESAVSKWYAWNRQCPTQTQCQSVRGSEPTVGFSFNILSCLKNLLLIILAWLHCKNFDPRSICKGLRALLPASSSRPFLIFSQYGQHCTLC